MKYILNVLILLLLIAQTAFASNITEVEEALRKAKKADYKTAIKILEPVYNQFRATGGTDRTKQDMIILARLNTALSSKYIKASDDAFGKKDYNTAFSYAQKAVDVNPKNWEGYQNMGAYYMRTGKHKNALPFINKALSIKENEYSYTALSECFTVTKQFNKAIEMADKAIKINPRFAMAYNNRGVAYHWLGKLEYAKRDYNKALGFNPNLEIARKNLSTL